MSNRKSIAIHSILYGAGRILSRALAFMLLPMLTRHIVPAEFGTWQLIVLLSSVLLPVSQLGLNNALFRFYIFADTKAKGRVLFNAISASTLWSFALFGVIYTLARPLSSFLLDTASKPGLILLGGIVGILDGWFILFTLIYRIEERPVLFTLYTLIQTGVTLIAAYILVVRLNMGVEGILLAFILGNLCGIVPVLPGLIKRMDVHFDMRILGEMLHFGLPFVPVMLTTIVFTMADRWLIKEMAGFDDAGIYSAGYRIGSLVLLVLTAFRFAWSPRMYVLFKKGLLKAALPDVFRHLGAVLALATAGLALFSREITGLFVDEAYSGALWIGPIVGSAYFFDGLCLLLESGIYVEGRTKVLPIITFFGAAMNIALNVYLIPKYGILGAAMATVLAYIFLAAMYFRVGQSLLPVRIPWLTLLLFVLVMASAFLYSWFFEGFWPRIGAFLALAGMILLQVGDDIKAVLGRQK